MTTKFNANYSNKTGLYSGRKLMESRSALITGILLLFLIVLAPVVDAGCSCSVGNWDPSGFLNSDSVTGQSAQPGSAITSASASPTEAVNRSDSFPNGKILKPMKSVSSSDLVIDVSNGNSYAAAHIENAIHIPTRDFLDSEGNLKAGEEIARILGDAGVSKDDSVVVYGSSESSGEAEFAYFVLSYLGQKNVLLLDGGMPEWKTAGLPTESAENKMAAVEYGPAYNSTLLADYGYLKSGQAQILDARPFVEFGNGRIPGSVALDPANIIKGDRIKDGGDLGIVFSRLSKDQPIVVYSSDYSRSSLVWYALQLMGFDARIYTWEDWKAHEATATGVKAAEASAGADAASSKYTKLGTT